MRRERKEEALGGRARDMELRKGGELKGLSERGSKMREWKTMGGGESPQISEFGLSGAKNTTTELLATLQLDTCLLPRHRMINLPSQSEIII